MNPKKYNTVECDSKYVCLKVMLTPSSLLNTEERYTRAELYKEEDVEIELELIHDKGNEHERRALEVYHNQLYIGHIRKRFQDDDIDNSDIVNDFCFEDNKLRDVSLFWSGEEFYLRRKTKEQREKEHKQSIIDRERQKKELSKEEKRQSMKEDRIYFYKLLLEYWKMPFADIISNSYARYMSSSRKGYDHSFDGAVSKLNFKYILLKSEPISSLLVEGPIKLRKPTLNDYDFYYLINKKFKDPGLNYWKSVKDNLKYNIEYLNNQAYGEYDTNRLKGSGAKARVATSALVANVSDSDAIDRRIARLKDDDNKADAKTIKTTMKDLKAGYSNYKRADLNRIFVDLAKYDNDEFLTRVEPLVIAYADTLTEKEEPTTSA